MQSEALCCDSSLRMAGACQLGCRNSKQYRRLFESSLKNEARRSALAWKCGGSWNRMGPALPPNSDRRSSSSSRLLTEFGERRFQCVMNLDAFQAKTKSLPVCSRQAVTDSGVGVR